MKRYKFTRNVDVHTRAADGVTSIKCDWREAGTIITDADYPPTMIEKLLAAGYIVELPA